MKLLRTVFSGCAVFGLPLSVAADPMVATEIEIFNTGNTFANSFGAVISDKRVIPSNGALGEDETGEPKIAFLGCRFDVVLETDDEKLNQAVQAINRKLASSDMAVPAGVGYLRNPKPISITDPVTVTNCSSESHYPFFLFRNSTLMGRVTIEFIVFEYDDNGLNVFRSAVFNDALERTSLTTARIVSNAWSLYRINYMYPTDIQADTSEKEEMVERLIFMAPTLLGIPIP